MTITALPSPPSTSDPTTFSSKADSLLSALPQFVTEANAQAVAVNSDAANTLAAKEAALAAVNATIWSSGTLYNIGDVRWSPTSFKSYRRKTNGGGTADPVSDPTNWQQLNGFISLDSAGSFGNRNKIIGGDFTTNPWQRGTSFTAPATATYSADRFLFSNAGTGVVDILKTVDAPTAAQAGVFTQHCLHVDVTTADTSIAAGDVYAISQQVEGLNAASFGFGQSGTRYVTLSFWHKHTKTGTYCIRVANSANNRSYVAEYTQDVTDTWEKATITIPVDTTGTWLYDTGIGIRLNFCLASGSTFQTTANTWATGNFLATANQVNALDNVSNNFKIALVQLEAGQTATPFETRSVGQELALCQRYYYRITGGVGSRLGVGHNNITTSSVISTTFPVPLRTSPTALEQSGTATDYDVQHANTATVCSVVPNFSSANSFMATFGFTVASGLTVGQGSNGRLANANGYLAWSAEL